VALSLLPVAVQETELFAFNTSAAVAMIGITASNWLKQFVPKLPKSPS
jgi:hypothetical protein